MAVPGSRIEAFPGGKPVIDVPGQTPASEKIRVVPILVRFVAASAAKILAEPIQVGTVRFSSVGPSVTGVALERALNWDAMKRRKASLSVQSIVHFIVTSVLK